MIHPHEQEERDYNMDNASDLQNALAHSRLENPIRRDPRINEELTLGRFVIVLCITRYCPTTDAILGTDRIFCSFHTVQEDAQYILNRISSDDDDRWHELECPKPVKAATPVLEDSTVPF